jgi:hypothetical protein
MSNNPLPAEYFPRKEVKSGTQRDVFTLMFLEALFLVAKVWNQPKMNG